MIYRTLTLALLVVVVVAAAENTDLGSAIGPEVASFDLLDHTDDLLVQECSDLDQREALFLWTAPAAGSYIVNVDLSARVIVFSGNVMNADDIDERSPLRCFEFFPGRVQGARFTASEAGETYTIIVEGVDTVVGDSYPITLAITEWACVGEESSAVGVLFDGNTETETDNYNLESAQCRPEFQARDVSFLWTAPATANFRVRAESPSATPWAKSVYVTKCDTNDLYHSNGIVDQDCHETRNLTVEFSATAGEEFLIIADGFYSTIFSQYFGELTLRVIQDSAGDDDDSTGDDDDDSTGDDDDDSTGDDDDDSTGDDDDDSTGDDDDDSTGDDDDDSTGDDDDDDDSTGDDDDDDDSTGDDDDDSTGDDDDNDLLGSSSRPVATWMALAIPALAFLFV